MARLDILGNRHNESRPVWAPSVSSEDSWTVQTNANTAQTPSEEVFADPPNKG